LSERKKGKIRAEIFRKIYYNDGPLIGIWNAERKISNRNLEIFALEQAERWGNQQLLWREYLGNIHQKRDG